VVVPSRKLEACEVVIREIQAEGGEAMAIAASISSKEQLQNLVEQTRLAVWPCFGECSGALRDRAHHRGRWRNDDSLTMLGAGCWVLRAPQRMSWGRAPHEGGTQNRCPAPAHALLFGLA